jgi:hypothetical protein
MSDNSRSASILLALGIAFAATLTIAACRGRAASSPSETSSASNRSDAVTADQLRTAVDRAAEYLAGLCDDQGKFTYRTHLDPDVTMEPRYNVLRHAGAIYALADYCQRSPNPKVQQATLRAASFLREQCFAPVAGNANLLAVWSEPDLVGPDRERQAKLGGAGLALIGLLQLEQIAPGSTPLDELRGLGRFLIFMQKPDGEFYSKYFPDRGRSDAWRSMYYPGEAALGLLMLYERDPQPQWLHTAGKALDAIARRGALQNPTLPDQWFLIATGRLQRLVDQHSLGSVPDAVLQHARRTCRDMLADQQGQLNHPEIFGCYTDDGRSCPSATRLEGLLAAMTFLPATDESLKSKIRESVRMGMQFLLRCQVVEGPHAGALPRVMPRVRPAAGDSDGDRAGEIRIDYVQHALSAMMQFEHSLVTETAPTSR